MLKKLNAAGWLAATVVAVLVLGSCFLGGRALWMRLRGLRTLAPMAKRTPEPTETPAAALPATVTPIPVETETPQGWATETDPFTGETYLSPPPEVEEQIRRAFEAVLAAHAIEDVSDQEALAYDRKVVIAGLERFASPEVAAWHRRELTEPDGEEMPAVFLAAFAPPNPVRCENHHVCTVGHVKTGSNGVILFSEEICAQIAPETTQRDRCVVRDNVEDQTSRLLYVATIEREDGSWRVTEWRNETF